VAEPLILTGALPLLENDCACPSPPVPLRPLIPSQQIYEFVGELYTTQLSEDWTLFCNTLAGGAPVVVNSMARERLSQFCIPQTLTASIDPQLAAAELIKPIGTQYRAPQGRISTMTAWIHITNACNLDCPYCYVRKSAKKMSLEIGIRAINAIIETAIRNGFTLVKLKYAGGEALLHWSLIQQLHAYAVQQSTLLGLSLQAVVLSNGTTIPSNFASWLADNGVRLMLSVDGVGADHDEQRPWKGRGEGAFASLQNNLTKHLLPGGIRPTICITVTGRTALHAYRAVDWAINYDLPFTLNFYRENEQSVKIEDLRFEENQIIRGMLDAYAVVEERLPTYPFLDGLLDHIQAQAHSYTCGVGQNYIVITHEGKVAQCHMTLEDAQQVGDGIDLIKLVSVGSIHNVSVDKKLGCQDCFWRYRCTGGCPIVTLRATGRTDVKSPNCYIYQTLIPQTLRLEGLRILKANGLSTL
jgi:uncharacterized protein